MARINLLPWRQEERQRKNKEFQLVLVAAAAVAALLVFVVYMFFNYRLDSQNQANDLIAQENQRLEGVLTEIQQLEDQRTAMLEQMKVIQNLQGRRSVPVRIWDDIARAIPSAMYVVGINRTDDVITLTGFADNANVISSLVRNLDASEWLADSAVPNISSDVEAYQKQSTKSPQNSNNQPRPIYPEDSYIRFTVTTKVQTEAKVQTISEADANADVEVQTFEEAPSLAPEPSDGSSETVAPAAPAEQPTSEATPTPVAPEQAPAGGQ